MTTIKRSYTNNNTEIFSICRSFLGNELKSSGYKIHGLYVCRYGSNCKEAHAWNQLHVKKHIRDWFAMFDKSSIDLLAIRRNIIDVITQARDTIKNDKFAVMNYKIHTMELVELFQYTYDILCHQRRIAKELPSRKTQSSEVPSIGVDGYRYKEEVNLLYLENEDIFWALQRTLHNCVAHIHIVTNPTMSHPATALCCGEANCKFGEHDASKIACVEDMMTGVCNCLKNAQDKTHILKEIDSLNKSTVDTIDADGFQVKLSKKIRDDILQQISSLKIKLALIPEPKILHYTRQGMIPYSKRIETDLLVKKKTEVDLTKFETSLVKKIVKKVY